MNFIKAFEQGKQGKSRGLSTGLLSLDKAIGGLKQKSIYGIAAAAKVGKTTLVDFCFVIHPFLYLLAWLAKNPDSKLNIVWDYFSYEIDRISKEFDYAAFFMFHDYQISHFMHKGKKWDISARYLKGELIDDEDEIIPVSEAHIEILMEIYQNRIIPLFGEYDEKGKKIKKGFINFMEERDNPTGMRNYLLNYYKAHGEFVYEPYYTTNEHGQKEEKKRLVGYNRENPECFHVVITDHCRKLKRERGFSMKENVDKWIEYSVDLRNLTHSSFIHVIHLNRSIADVQRIKFESETLHGTSDDIKDTGNLSEECNYLLTMFNPRDEKYKLETHFGHTLSNYPGYRSLHLVESRDTECPQHLFLQLFGNIKTLKEI